MRRALCRPGPPPGASAAPPPPPPVLTASRPHLASTSCAPTLRRQVALVCRRWRALYWQCALWSTFEGGWDYQTWLRSTPTALPAPNRELNTRLLRVLRRIGGGLGSFRLAAAALIAFDDGQTLTELLRCLRRERATAVRLSSEARHDPGDDGLGFTLPHFDPLPACAVRTVSHLRGLTSLSLDSWHLPHCTVDVLARLPRLQELRLRARQLPPGCLAAVLQLADLRSLELSTTMQLGSVSQLSCLTRLTHLALHQHNQAGMPLEPPPVASLPHLQSYSFSNERGPLQVRCSPPRGSRGCEQLRVTCAAGATLHTRPTHASHAQHTTPLQLPGGCLRSADFSSTGYHGGGAQLRLSSSWLTPRLTSLSALLDGLLPAGTQLRLLKVHPACLLAGLGAAALFCGVLHVAVAGASLMPACLPYPHCRSDISCLRLAKPSPRCGAAASWPACAAWRSARWAARPARRRACCRGCWPRRPACASWRCWSSSACLGLTRKRRAWPTTRAWRR